MVLTGQDRLGPVRSSLLALIYTESQGLLQCVCFAPLPIHPLSKDRMTPSLDNLKLLSETLSQPRSQLQITGGVRKGGQKNLCAVQFGQVRCARASKLYLKFELRLNKG